MKRLSSLILRLFGWKVTVTVEDYPKSIICVAPHTSNWDFILGKMAYASVGRKAGFLMKKFWFFWPLGPIFKSMGGVPVGGNPGVSLTAQLIERFKTSDKLNIAITPEGTRSRTTRWHTGFLHVALEAHVPITLAYIDFPSKTINMSETFIPSGDISADMKQIKEYFRPYTGKYPDKFSTDTDTDGE